MTSAVLYGVDRATITRAVHQVRPLLGRRGFAVPDQPGPRLHTLADVVAYAAAQGVESRIDDTETQVRRPRATGVGGGRLCPARRSRTPGTAVVRIWAGLGAPKRAWEVPCLIVEHFFYCRGRPGTEGLLEELAEAHWSFMDGYAEAMIARGPTLTPDRTRWTGSMHMVDLPDAPAARVFAFQEPFYRAGVYDQVLVRRWRNALGRTMWDYPAELGDDRRFLVICHGKPGVDAARQALAAAQRRWFGEPGHRDGLILRGPLLSDDGAGWVGSALLVQLGDRAAVEAMLAAAPYVRAGLYASVEIHDWQFGGRHQG